MRGAEAAGELDDGIIHVGGECGHGAADPAAAVAVPAEQHRKTGNQVADFRDLEVSAGPGAESRDALGLQRGQIRATVLLPHAVQKQGPPDRSRR